VAERPLEKQTNPKPQNKSREKKGRRSEVVHFNVKAKSRFRGEKTGDPVGGMSVWQLACANSTAAYEHIAVSSTLQQTVELT
jgi:hypothetical protein